MHQEPYDFKLIVCDIDGTLAIKNKIVSPELREVFAELQGRGVQTALCTGRMPHWTEGVAAQLNLDGYTICNEGGLVFHRGSGEILHHALLPQATVELAWEIAHDDPYLRPDLAVMCRDQIFTTSELAGQRAHWWGFRWQVVEDPAVLVEPSLAVISGAHASVRLAWETMRQADLPAETFLHPVEDHGEYAHFKICHVEGDKGVAAERLAQHFGGDRSSILAFGDHTNDLGMLHTAGLSICPRQAAPIIHEAATLVSEYTTEEGFVLREVQRIFGLN